MGTTAELGLGQLDLDEQGDGSTIDCLASKQHVDLGLVRAAGGRFLQQPIAVDPFEAW